MITYLWTFELLGFMKKSYANSTEDETQPELESTKRVCGLQKGVMLGSRVVPVIPFAHVAWLFIMS